MNIVSIVVGSALMASLAPAVANMSIQPFAAAKRANNFAVAESTAVGYSAKNEGGAALTPIPESCFTAELEGNSYTVTCWHSEGQFKQSVSRSFRLASLCEDGNGHGTTMVMTAPTLATRITALFIRPASSALCGTHGELSITTIATTYSASPFPMDHGLALTKEKCFGRSRKALAQKHAL